MRLHVVSFQVPFPADYGGAIDVYYKLKALHSEGFDITLHTFFYDSRTPQPCLETICRRVFYYPRKTGWTKQFSTLPYIVASRTSPQLLANLCADDAPILFEGLHTCLYLAHPALRTRRKYVRMHNVEHAYYLQLAHQAHWNWRTLFYRVESWRLKRFEKQLIHADGIAAITDADSRYFAQRLPGTEVFHLPCFFDAEIAATTTATQPFVLYHGNLAVEENSRVVKFILQQIVPLCPEVRFIIAGRNPSFGTMVGNVSIIANPTDEQLDELLRTARIHLMLTFQPTGIKLKLLNALVKGNGHIIANTAMLHGHDFGRFCTHAETPRQVCEGIRNLLPTPPTAEALEARHEAILQMAEEGRRGLHRFAPNA